jgi:hypothetical protein
MSDKDQNTALLLTARIVPNYSAFRKRNRPKRWQVPPLFEIARVLVRLDHVARFIVNADHSIM